VVDCDDVALVARRGNVHYATFRATIKINSFYILLFDSSLTGERRTWAAGLFYYYFFSCDATTPVARTS